MVIIVEPTNKYSYSFDGERYYGEFDTIAEVLTDARVEAVNYPDSTKVYIGKNYQYKPRVQAHRVIEDIQEDAFDEAGEAAEDYLEYVSAPSMVKLEKMLTKTFIEWAKENNQEPRFYIAKEIEVYSLEGDKVSVEGKL